MAPRTGEGGGSGLATEELFGLDFVSEATIDDVVAVLLVDDGGSGWSCLVTPNVDHVVRYRRHPADRVVAEAATIVLPDGMPIVWAGRLLRRPLRSRLAGSDLFATLWPRLAADAVPTVVVASRPEVADQLAREHPTAAILQPPMFSLDDPVAVDALLDDVLAACDRVGARFLISGISTDKGHHLAGLLHDRWGDGPGHPTVLLLGASAELYVGVKKRAPAWMQRAGLEWVHRMLSDPRRLVRRYLVDDASFVIDLWREWRSRGRGPRVTRP